MSRGRGDKLRPFCFRQLRPKPLQVNELTEFQELQDFHHVELLSVKFGEITDTKTDTVKFASSVVFARPVFSSNGSSGVDSQPALEWVTRAKLKPWRSMQTQHGLPFAARPNILTIRYEDECSRREFVARQYQRTRPPTWLNEAAGTSSNSPMLVSSAMYLSQASTDTTSPSGLTNVIEPSNFPLASE